MFAIIDRYIGEREIFLDKNKKEFTQMIYKNLWVGL